MWIAESATILIFPETDALDLEYNHINFFLAQVEKEGFFVIFLLDLESPRPNYPNLLTSPLLLHKPWSMGLALEDKARQILAEEIFHHTKTFQSPKTIFSLYKIKNHP